MNTPELIDQLEKLPAEIARYAEQAENLRLEYEKKKLLYDNEYDKCYLLTKAKNPKYTQEQVKAEARSLCYELRLEAIRAESDFKSRLIKMTEADNRFTGLKVATRLMMAEMSAGLGGKE